MRIYEFAKQIGKTNKELLELLAKGGFKVTSHMAVLTDDARAYLEKLLAKPVQPTPAPQPVAQPKAPMTQPVQPRPTYQASPGVARPPISAPVVKTGPIAPPAVTSVNVTQMTVDQFAQKIKKPVGEVILTLLKKGVRATRNELLKPPVIADVARHYGIEPIFPEKKEAAPIMSKRVAGQVTASSIDRMPVVVVMGHVDHGKTSLLDYIRKTRVASREKGGITQHLGAYEVQTAHGGIVFIDTPGHQAFTQMRARGTKAADIAVLVVAADDSIKPQTVEALKIAQSAELPIIVAVNKMDKAAPERVDVVKRDAAKYELMPEEWGGSTIFVPISAKTGAGVDSLLEIIALQSQLMELKADPAGLGTGFILESKVEKGRGFVATVICHEGTVRLGDYFLAGAAFGKVTSMVDSLGRRVTQALPSHPVQIAGFEDLPAVGDPFTVVPEPEYRAARAKGVQAAPKTFAREHAVNVIIKAEGAASLEAVLGGLTGLGEKGDKELAVIQSGVGPITEGDVMLAQSTGATIIGLHVKPEANAAVLATRQGVSVQLYEIIYQLFDALKLSIKGIKEVVKVKQKIGEVVVRKVFAIKGIGVIAGCYVKEGKITRDCSVVIWRGKEKIGEGKIESLQRERKTVKEIAEGFECAFMVKGFEDWAVDDRADVYLEVVQGTI